jgi:4-hydroxybenzoate polyprenyltransferase
MMRLSARLARNILEGIVFALGLGVIFALIIGLSGVEWIAFAILMTLLGTFRGVLWYLYQDPHRERQPTPSAPHMSGDASSRRVGTMVTAGLAAYFLLLLVPLLVSVGAFLMIHALLLLLLTNLEIRPADRKVNRRRLPSPYTVALIAAASTIFAMGVYTIDNRLMNLL